MLNLGQEVSESSFRTSHITIPVGFSSGDDDLRRLSEGQIKGT